MKKDAISDDAIWLIIVGTIVLSGVTMNIDPIWSRCTAWLIDHQLVVTEAILLPFPGGVGLDLSRVAVLAAVLLVLVGLAILARQRRQKG